MQTKIGTKSKALVFLLTLAMSMSYMFMAGPKEDWRAYAADANNSQYSLSSAEYWVYTDSGCTTRAKDANGNNAVLTTKADGTTSEIELEQGTYYVKEAKASKGYVLDKTVYTAVVNSGETSWVNASGGNQVKEVPQSAPLSIQKVDMDSGQNVAIAGIQFEVKYTDGGSVNKTWVIETDTTGLAKLDAAHQVSGDALYKNSQNQVVVPIGKVTVKEISNPLGYAKSDEVYTIQIKWDGNNASSETTKNVTGSGSKGGTMDTNPIKVKYRDKKQSAPLKIQKIDKETGKATPMGGAKFAGATFELTCTSGEDSGKKWIMKADENGVASLEKVEAGSSAVYKNSEGKAALLLGKYTLKETSAPEGYNLNSGTYTFTVAGDNSGSETTSAVTGTDDKSGAKVKANPLEISFPNQVIRGDLDFNKHDQEDNDRMEGVAFVIKSATTGESHVVVTDENGYVSTEAEFNKHTNETNGNDYVIDADGNAIIGANGKIDESNLVSLRGLWFCKDKEGNEAETVNDELGALPYDTYYITELPGTENEGKEMLKGVRQVIRRNDYVVFGGSWGNNRAPYEMYKVRNEEASSNGADKFGFQPGDFVTYDVHVKNPYGDGKLQVDVSDEFEEGAEYFSKPVVMKVTNAKQNKLSSDKNVVNITIEPTQEAIVTYGAMVLPNAKEYLAGAAKDSDSLNAGKDCNYTEQTNTPDDEDGYVNFAYTRNAKFIPTNGGSPDELPEKDDPAQTPVKEPKIGTYLADGAGRKIVSGEKIELVDTVKYEGLTPGKTYVFEGTLIAKDTADPLVENGKKVTARSEEFVPTEANGETTVKFTVDAKGIMGKELVAFETAYKVKEEDGSKPKDENGEEVPEVEVAKHEDIDDPAQTVEVPGYKMYKVRNEAATAKGNKYGFEPGQTVTYDVVIENISKTASIKMDVTDQFTEHPEYFTTPRVIEVKEATENSRSDDDNTVNITVEAGKKAVVTFAADIKEEAKEYLAADAKDSDSKDKDGNDVNKKEQANKTDDKDGYRNIAKVENPVPEDPDDPDPEEPNNPLPPDEDESQTPVKKPEIGTYLADDANRKDIGSSETTALVDTVKYEGLTPGQKYAVVGELIVKDTEEPLVENGEKVRAVGVFTPDKPNGETTVTFAVDTRDYLGKQLVAFEVAYNITGADLPDDPTPSDVEEKGKKVAEHKDPSDPDQTVTVKQPEIGTYLADDANQKVIGESEKTTLIDTVAYKGLTPGQDYAVVGELIVKETGNPLVESGTAVKAVGTFTAKEESGSTDVTFVVNTKGMKGMHLVAFETAYNITGAGLSGNPTAKEVEDSGKYVAEHKDLTDSDQTVLIDSPDKPGRKIDTGDSNILLFVFGGSFAAAIAALFAMLKRRKAQSLK